MTKKQDFIKSLAEAKNYKTVVSNSSVTIYAEKGVLRVTADGQRHFVSFSPAHIAWNSTISMSKALELVGA